jgi:tRNA A-37 threonylcarbamoyl transferase component Bud32/tetratricopeptide (TPR) repeat protein
MIEPTHTTAPEPPTVTADREGDRAPDAAPLTAPMGYELGSLIGEGGMGVVYRARELAINRDVAVKFLQSRFAPESAIGRRFAEEARITGQLQHPGIPPVHQVGTLPDGRPFLVMKLIKGDTLAELLEKRGDPGAERGRYLAIFEQTAQAVGYAHAHLVIHRDLKPANVMVGSFGEVQVMDWGLAKVLDPGRPAEAASDEAARGTEIRSLREGVETTQAGSLLGTPAFMPPEQAIGAVDQITERSDVFGLGAILCVILTGQPPFVAESAESTRRMAARAKLDEAFARLDGCAAEPELIHLTKRCLAAEPGDRPRDAGEVAGAITALRADAELRARQAELERARAEVRSAEERKRRRVQRALALTVLTLFAVAGFAAWWIEGVRADRLTREAELLSRQLAAERDVVAALNEAQVLREEGRKQADDPPRWALTLTAARSSWKRAQALLESGEPTDEFRARVAAAGAELARDERDRSLLEQLDRIAEENEVRFLMPVVLSGRQADQYARAFRAYGVDLAGMPTSAAVAWLKGHRFRDRLITAVRNQERALPFTDAPGCQGRPSIRDRLNAILKAVTEDPFAREWFAAVERKDAATLKKLIARPEFARLSSRELSSLADSLGTTIQPEVLSELLAAAYARFPGEFWVNFRLGVQGIMEAKRRAAEKPTEAIRHLTAAVAARPRSALARVYLGSALLGHRKDDPMVRRMLHGAAAVDPSSPWPHLFLGFVAQYSGNWPDAARSFQKAVRLDPDVGFVMIFSIPHWTLKSPHPGDLARWYDELIATHPRHAGGYALRAAFRVRNGDYRSALADFRRMKPLASPDFPLGGIAFMEHDNLERMALWEKKLPAVLRGELRPAKGGEGVELAEYCAGFEKKYVLAVRFAAEAFAADPKLYGIWIKTPRLAGWAVQAAAGKGVDAADLSAGERSRLRGKALAWLRETRSRIPKELLPTFAMLLREDNPDLAAVRDPEALASLPPDERADWSRFWNKLPTPGPKKPSGGKPGR